MPQPRACTNSRRARCPYLEWSDDPSGGRPKRAIAYGQDRYGNQRFRCKVEGCGGTFVKPPPSEGGLPTFREAMRQEAKAARTLDGEPIKDVAVRLGVSRRSIQRWAKFESYATPGAEEGIDRFSDFDLYDPNSAYSQFQRRFVERMRWVRRSGRVAEAPYTLDAQDQPWHDRAAYGEVKFWLLDRRIMKPRGTAAWDAVMEDRRATMRDRQAVVMEARRRLVEADQDEITLPDVLRSGV